MDNTHTGRHFVRKMSFYVHLYICVLLLNQITQVFAFTLPFNTISSRVVPRRPTNSTVKPVNYLPNVSTGPDCDLRSAYKSQDSNLFATGTEVIKPLSVNGANKTPFFYENIAAAPKKSTVSSSDVTPSSSSSSILLKSESSPSILPAPYVSHLQSESGLKAPIPVLDWGSLSPITILTPSCFDSSNLNVASLHNPSMLPKIAPVNSESTNIFSEVPTTMQLPLVINKTPPLSLNQDNNIFPIINNDLVKSMPVKDAILRYKNLPKMSVPIPAYNSTKTNNCENRLDLSVNFAKNEYIYFSNSVQTSPINKLVNSVESPSLDININPSVFSTGNKMVPQILPSETLPTKNTVQGLTVNNFASNEIKNTNGLSTSNTNNHSFPVSPNLIVNTNTQIPQIMSMDTAPQNLQCCLKIDNSPAAFNSASFSSLLLKNSCNVPLPICESTKCPSDYSKSDTLAATNLNCLNFPITNYLTGSQSIIAPLPINDTSSISPIDLTFVPKYPIIANSNLNQAPNTVLINKLPFTHKDTYSTIDCFDGNLTRSSSVPKIIPESLNLKILPISTGQPIQGVVRPLLKNNTKYNSTLDLLNIAPSTETKQSVANSIVSCNSMNRILRPYDNCDSKPLLNSLTQPSLIKVNNTSSISPKDLTVVPQYSCIVNSNLNQPLNTLLIKQIPFTNRDTSSAIDCFENLPAQPIPSITKVSLPLNDENLPKSNSVPKIIPESLNLKMLPISTGQTIQGAVRNNTKCISTPDLLNIAPSTETKQSVANSIVSCNSMNQILSPYDNNCDSKLLLNSLTQPSSIQIPCLKQMPPSKENSPQRSDLPKEFKSLHSFISSPSLPKNTCSITTNTFEPKTFLCDNIFNTDSLPINIIPKLTTPVDLTVTPSVSNGCTKNTFDNHPGLLLPIIKPPMNSNIVSTTSCDENINLEKALVFHSGLPNSVPIPPIVDISIKPSVNYDSSLKLSTIDTSSKLSVLNLPITSNAIPFISTKNTASLMCLPPQNECILSSPYGIISPQVPYNITDNIPKTSSENCFRLSENGVPFQTPNKFLPISHLPTGVIKPKSFSVNSEFASLNSASKYSDLCDINKICLNNSGYNVLSNLPQINYPTSPSYLPNYCVPSEDVNNANKNVIVENQPPKLLNTPIGPLDVSKIATLLQKPFLKVPSLYNIQPVTTPNPPIKPNLLPPLLPSIQNSKYIDSQVPNILFSGIDPTKVYSCVQTDTDKLIPMSICTPKALPVPTCVFYPEITLPSILPRNDYQQLTKPISEVAIPNIPFLQPINDNNYLTTGTTFPLTNAILNVSSRKSFTGNNIVSTNRSISSIELIPIEDMLQLVEIYSRDTPKINLQKNEDKRLSSLDNTLKINTPLELFDVSYLTPNTVPYLSLENIVSPVNNIKLFNPKSNLQNPFNLQHPLSIGEKLDPTSTVHPNSGVFVDILLPVAPESLSTLPNSYSRENPFCISRDIQILRDLLAVPLTETISPIKIEPPKSTDQTNLSTLNTLTTKLTNACLASAISNLTSSYDKRTIPEVHEIPKVTIYKVNAKLKSKKRKPGSKISKRIKNKNSNNMFECASIDIPVNVDANEAKNIGTDHLPDILSTTIPLQYTDKKEFAEKDSKVAEDTLDLDDLSEDCGVNIEPVLSLVLSNFKEKSSESWNNLISLSKDKQIPHYNTLEELAEYIVLKELVNSNLNSNWDLLEKIIDILCIE